MNNKIRNKIELMVLISFLIFFSYMLLGMWFKLPMPEFYKKELKEQVDSAVANDPMMKLNEAINRQIKIEIRKDRKIDSLQHLVDSLLKN